MNRFLGCLCTLATGIGIWLSLHWMGEKTTGHMLTVAGMFLLVSVLNYAHGLTRGRQ